MLDSRVRPGHAKHHGLVLPKDDPFWDTHYPPNAWNCRCKVNAYTKSQLEKRGYEVSKVAPEGFAHKDWAYHVGKTDNISKIYDSKIAKISDKGLKKAALKEKQRTTLVQQNKDKLFNNVKTMSKTPLNEALKSKKKIVIARASKWIKEAFKDDKIDNIFLSEYTLVSHLVKPHHKNIMAWDYYYLSEILKKEPLSIEPSSSKESHKVIVYKYGGKQLKVVIKKTSFLEIFIQSISKGSKVK